MSQNETIYEEIGGQNTVEAVVSDFYDLVFEDPLLEPHFADIDRDALYAHQVQFISAVAGGPVSYSGNDMQQAHEGMNITEEAFEQVATYLADALRMNGVEEKNVDAILEEVEQLEPAVVGQ